MIHSTNTLDQSISFVDDPYSKTGMDNILQTRDLTTLNEVLDGITKAYIKNRGITPENHPSLQDMERELVSLVEYEISTLNAGLADKSSKMRCPKSLTVGQIKDLLFASYHIVRINLSGSTTDVGADVLCVYESSGKDEGTYKYEPGNESIKRLITQLNYRISAADKKAVLERLYEEAPRNNLTKDRDLIPVANGVFNFATKELLPFSPEYIFMEKSDVDYNPNAKNVIIHNDEDGTDWDVESWMNELSSSPKFVAFLWEILAAIVRPFVAWGKAIFLLSTAGCNGKGTLLALARALTKGTTSLQISNFSERFGLEKLIGKNAILCDENDVGDYIEKCANFKAVITNDVVSIDRKGLPIIDYKFDGVVVMCLNSKFRTKDRTDSFYRRCVFLTFEKSFTGAERKYIKEDYIHRKDVLEYVLFRILHLDFYEFDIPEECKEALDEFKSFNDPVRRFVDEMLPQLAWDFVPFEFIHDLYVSWCRRTNPSGRPIEKEAFIDEFLQCIEGNPNWCCTDKRQFHRPGKKMGKPEYLIHEYELQAWYRHTFCGGELEKICTPDKLKTSYRGIHRVVKATDDDPTDATEK